MANMQENHLQPTALIMAGGTGGHVFPGLAVAQLLLARGWKVSWLGNPKGMEASLVSKHGIAMEPVDFGGLRGKGLLTKLRLPLNLLRACLQARAAIARVKPQVVLGLGGYITFPGGLMARLGGLPLVLHEQNSIAGLANRVLAKIANAVLVAFPGALNNAQWVGNPVRADIAKLASPQERYAHREGQALKMLVVGGSLGAKVLNDTVPQALAIAKAAGRAFEVTHQCGKGQSGPVSQAYGEQGITADARDFIDDMAQAYAQADLVICRAGAMTVSELAAVGVASILVPFPHAVDDHQTTNARFLSNASAAWLVPQAEFNVQRLAEQLLALDRSQCLAAANRAASLAKLDATESVADTCERLVKRST